MKSLRIGIALEAQLWFGSGCGGPRVIADFVDSRPRRCAVYERRVNRRARMKNDGDKIIVDRQRRYSRAITPHRVVDAPAWWVSLRSEVAVVRNNIAGNFLHARRHQLIRQISQRFLRRAVALGVFHKRNHAAGWIGVPPAD